MTLLRQCGESRGEVSSLMTARYPKIRMRRNRSSDFVRRLVRENELSANDVIYPMFVVAGSGMREPIESMPGIERLSLDALVAEAKLLNLW